MINTPPMGAAYRFRRLERKIDVLIEKSSSPDLAAAQDAVPFENPVNIDNASLLQYSIWATAMGEKRDQYDP